MQAMLNQFTATGGTMADKKKENKNEDKIKEMREQEYQKRQKREQDIKRESSDGFEKKIAGD